MSAFTKGLYSEASSELQYEMLDGETLLWMGQPSRKVIFHSNDIFAIPFSLMWGGFAIFWELGVTGSFQMSAHSAPSFFVLWGIPFVVIGQYMIWGRFLYTAWRKSHTYYAVTNKRAIILNTAPSRKVTDRSLRNLGNLSISTRTDGIGTIEFQPVTEFNPNFGWGNRRSRNQLDINLSNAIFYDIPDARAVYQIIQAQREKIGAGPD
ncbi:MAG TPA: hypothetical protein VGF01_17730 [Terracidiphilus sp.]